MDSGNQTTSFNILLAVCGSIVFVGALFALLKFLDFEQQLITFLEYIRNTGNIGRTLFFMAVTLAVVLLLPSVLLTLAAGYLYGIVGGLVMIVLAETVGAYIAFVIGRRCQHRRFMSALKNKQIFESTSRVLTFHGWRMIALIRMIPFFPFKLSNYAFGLTNVGAWQYIIGTLIGLAPISFFNVYLGSLSGDLMTLGSAGLERTPLQWGLYVAGFVAVILLVVVMAQTATKRLSDDAA